MDSDLFDEDHELFRTPVCEFVDKHVVPKLQQWDAERLMTARPGGPQANMASWAWPRQRHSAADSHRFPGVPGSLVRAYNRRNLAAVDAAKAKYWATELQGRVVDAGVQLHGGYGYMLEYPVAKALIDARIQRIYGGTNEIMKEIIRRDLMAAS